MKKISFFLSILDYIFPFILTFLFFIICVELFTYFGSMRKVLFLDSNISFILITITSTLFLSFALHRKNYKFTELNKYFSSLLFLFFPLLIFLYISLNILESRNFPNYVFSTYHLHLTVLQKLVTAYIFVILCFSLVKARKSILTLIKESTLNAAIDKKRIDILISILVLTQIIFLLSFLIYNTVKVIPLLASNTTYIASHLFDSYDSKMSHNWGFFYEYMLYIKSIVPETGSIAIPPAQSHWLSTGNIVLVRYFLYPRKVYNLVESSNVETVYKMPKDNYDYVLLTQGLWADTSIPYGWPKQKIETKRIYVLNRDTKEKNMYETESYKPEDYEDTQLWGVIELAEESK